MMMSTSPSALRGGLFVFLVIFSFFAWLDWKHKNFGLFGLFFDGLLVLILGIGFLKALSIPKQKHP
jgi:hypothetical protein